eukprot:CAMPEP_0185260678 /NCGR_PEP_ID=MMETSP1359-20130426/9241_1 /TAXON_ID=552665 /ORGANISM="Bigelowiella longifila, Strain CCMP242" /LENGTH=163 /DNA_ID=CAMNT_0027847051 /DNA_START=256 /DNA_END=747 /DNA_ORIENTATION=+
MTRAEHWTQSQVAGVSEDQSCTLHVAACPCGHPPDGISHLWKIREASRFKLFDPPPVVMDGNVMMASPSRVRREDIVSRSHGRKPVVHVLLTHVLQKLHGPHGIKFLLRPPRALGEVVLRDQIARGKDGRLNTLIRCLRASHAASMIVKPFCRYSPAAADVQY